MYRAGHPSRISVKEEVVIRFFFELWLANVAARPCTRQKKNAKLFIRKKRWKVDREQLLFGRSSEGGRVLVLAKMRETPQRSADAEVEKRNGCSSTLEKSNESLALNDHFVTDYLFFSSLFFRLHYREPPRRVLNYSILHRAYTVLKFSRNEVRMHTFFSIKKTQEKSNTFCPLVCLSWNTRMT